MKIGVPKEIKDQEFRVSLTPAGVGILTRQRHQVFVESGAGVGSGFPDAAYRKAKARILKSKKSLFEQSELIVKVKEPLPEEGDFFHPGQILFTYLHLAANKALMEVLITGKVTAIAYETIELADGSRPLLRPMSEIAGRMAVLAGAHYLQKTKGGMGLLLTSIAGVSKGKVCVIGGGVVGRSAAQVALALGAEVTVIDESSSCRSRLDDFFRGRVVTLPSYPDEIADQVKKSCLVIGAVSRVGDKAPHLVTRRMISKMEKGAVVVDVAIDQGGCFETSRPTSHSDPIYTVKDVVHYCVTNIPGAVPRTATFALANETFPYVQKLALLGLKRATETDIPFSLGVNTHQGEIVHPGVAKAFGLRTV
ncbi:MAG: alanine dehydrogenase [Nitrospira sp.]|nr:alanine dehydrogenase [Candidatus Manganitrophaceae bacterium]HIL35596.1 alanine dehydrogenase [Candidatus Manganitrophaceae bacterium]